MNRDHDLEEKFYSYLASLDYEDARNAALPVFQIVQTADDDFEDNDY